MYSTWIENPLPVTLSNVQGDELLIVGKVILQRQYNMPYVTRFGIQL